MNFGAPSFLWMSAALLPLVAAYFLKVRPRRMPVNALFLWDKIFQEKKASSLFQKLRDFLSLLMLALALAAVVLAAAELRARSGDRRDLLVVIDVSPSMRAKTGGRSGIDAARERAREIVRALNGTRRAALAVASDELEFLSHASDAPKDLTDAIGRVAATDLPVSRRAVQSLNACARGAGSRGRVLLITDGNPGWDGLDSAVEIMRLPAAGSNAGFVAADLDRSPGTRSGARFFYRIASTVTENSTAELELRHEERGLARLIPVTLEPGVEATGTLDIEDAAAGRWTAELRFPDALDSDNLVALGLVEPKPVAVAVTARDSHFFRRCIEAFSLTGGMLAPADGEAEVTIAFGAPADVAKQIVFAPSGDSPFWSAAGGEIETLAAETKVPDHPVVRHLEFEAIRFEGARDFDPAAGSLVLAVSETGRPLMWKSRVDGRDAVVVNLDPTRGDFFFSPAFPALVHGAATDLGGRGKSLRSAVPTGTRLASGGRVTTPSGRALAAGDIKIVAAGHHLAETTAGPRWFGAAFFERAETMLDGSGPADSGTEVERGYPLSFWLLVIAIVLVLTEYLLYHRRKAG